MIIFEKPVHRMEKLLNSAGICCTIFKRLSILPLLESLDNHSK
jgi:hypothetical protein